jgi:ABC-type sugar transport system substrate-binding protein
LAGCAQAPALDLIKEGYVDGLSDVDAWALIDHNVKATLLSVCCGLDVPKHVDIPVAFYTKDNVETPRWGAPLVWGYMVKEYPNFDDWPVLDSGILDIPTVAMKKAGY